MCVCAVFPRGDGAAARHGATRRGTPRHSAMLLGAALALLCAALVHADRDKRAEMSPVPFVMGSRYGRSPERVMTPRNDRFFMGSRYGKRSEIVPVEEASRALSPRWGGGRSEGCDGAQCHQLVCQYTGVMALFKCVRPHKQLQFVRRSAEDGDEGEAPDRGSE